MRAALTGIDHVVIAVRDLERAARDFARLGFTVTPRGVHTLGSQNHCITFGTDYLELLAVPQPHAALAYYRDFLQRGEGIAALALASADARAARAELHAAALRADEPLEFSRPVQLAEGSGEARFRIVQLDPSHTPGCRAFVCEHFTPQLVWRADWQRHALGVTGIAALAVVTDEVEATARAYAALFAEKPQTIDQGRLVASGTAPLAFATRGRLGRRLDGVALPARARPLVAALFLRVTDREHAGRTLARSGARVVRLADGSFAVGADEAHGVTLVFG